MWIIGTFGSPQTSVNFIFQDGCIGFEWLWLFISRPHKCTWFDQFIMKTPHCKRNWTANVSTWIRFRKPQIYNPGQNFSLALFYWFLNRSQKAHIVVGDICASRIFSILTLTPHRPSLKQCWDGNGKNWVDGQMLSAGTGKGGRGSKQVYFVP